MFIEVLMTGKNKNNLSKNETICTTCNGSTVGDFGQPFECEDCDGTGSIPLFEVKI